LLVLFKSVDRKIIKLADFGESKPVSVGLSTYCGTPDYMAPEIIKGVAYGPEVDMWALGVTAFVMIGGYAPFEGENDSEVFAAILTLNYKYISPEWDHVGTLGKDFIDSLLKIDPKKRLTSRAALAHPFVTKFVNPKECAAPMMPQEGNAQSKKLGEIDARNPKGACLLAIDETISILKNEIGATSAMSPMDAVILGELAYIKQIVDATTQLTPLEKSILTLSWNRLKDIRELRFH